MGCDIHMILERKASIKGQDKWVGIETISSNLVNRNYDFFGALAGVRRDTDKSPRGIPEDASDLSVFKSTEYGEDGHSHSWGTAEEVLLAYISTSYDKPEELQIEALRHSAKAQKTMLERLTGVDTYLDSDVSLYRFVYWFDN